MSVTVAIRRFIYIVYFFLTFYFRFKTIKQREQLIYCVFCGLSIASAGCKIIRMFFPVLHLNASHPIMIAAPFF